MNGDRVFVDTNVFIYLYTDSEPLKQKRASDAMAGNICHTGLININETITVLSKKFHRKHGEIVRVLESIAKTTKIISLELRSVTPALRIMDRYGYSYYDSLVIALALETNCSRLLTEDMQHGQVIDGRLTLDNVFNA